MKYLRMLKPRINVFIIDTTGNFGDYLGIGAGAHSKITDFHQQIIKRHWQVKNPKDYLSRTHKFTASESILNEKALGFEFMLNALRLTDGRTAFTVY